VQAGAYGHLKVHTFLDIYINNFGYLLLPASVAVEFRNLLRFSSRTEMFKLMSVAPKYLATTQSHARSRKTALGKKLLHV
jgi:hypothetical protein